VPVAARGDTTQEALCCAYSQARAILGVTMDGQRAAGMINNRVFEALACGRGGQARFIADYFPELESTLPGLVR
jgi:spore maturation protein CgeB